MQFSSAAADLHSTERLFPVKKHDVLFLEFFMSLPIPESAM